MLIRLAHGGLAAPLALLLLALSLIWSSTPALAQQASAQPYRVVIQGAGPYTELLTKHLDIVRRQNDTDLSVAEVERRVNVTPSQIRELLATEGYFSATVQHELVRDTSPWVARFVVELGVPTTIESVEIQFKGALATGSQSDPARMQALRRNWSLKPGAVFEQDAWAEAKSGLLRELLVRDYPAASISQSEARIDPAENSASLHVTVDSGPQFTFGKLEIDGLERYSRAMVERLNPIRPGAPYSQEKLNELQDRLQGTGYFRSAFATVEIDPAQPTQVPIQVDLTENPRKRLALGGGISTDTGLRLQTKWLDRNFLQRDWRLESELLVDRETRLGAVDLFLRPLSNGWQPSISTRLERSLSSGETDDKIRTSVRLTSPNRVDEKTWALSLMADRQRIGETFVNDRSALIGTFVYTKRRFDDPLNPRRGYVAAAEIGFGPRGLVNEDNIARLVLRANALYPLGKRLRIQARGQLGQVFGSDRLTVPGDLLFRTGGDRSVRGYAYQSLGVAQNGAIVGGTVVAVMSAELVYQITPQWGAAVFTDVGDAAESWGALNLVRGTGIGARWSSPIGQVNADVGYGHATREPRLHFSVGYGF